MKHEEDNLQKAVVQYHRHFGSPGYIMFAVPNGGKRSKASAGRLKAMGVLAGVSDLIVIGPKPEMFYLELKSSTGRLSDAQKDFRDDVEALGWTYAVAKSPEEAVNALLTWGALTCDPLRRAEGIAA